MSLIIAIIVLYIECKLVKRVFIRKHRKLKKQSQTSMDYSSIAGLSIKINRRGFLDDDAESDQISKVTWYDKNRKVSIKGYSITDGMVYVDRGNAEASLLDGKLPVSVAEPDEGWMECPIGLPILDYQIAVEALILSGFRLGGNIRMHILVMFFYSFMVWSVAYLKMAYCRNL